MKPRGVIIHHSLTKDGKVCDWAGIKRYHMQEKGWSDIGYHLGIERVEGVLTTLTGRPLYQVGAHCLGHNDTIGLCIVGNFDLAPPDDETLRYAASLVSGHLRMFDLPIESVRRHHDFAAKSCPGSKFPWEKFIELIEASI